MLRANVLVVCKDDRACAAFRPRSADAREAKEEEEEEEENEMVCYKGGLAVEQNFQMCDVTSNPTPLSFFLVH